MNKRGRLVAIFGPMFSGKTTYLIEQFDRGKNTVVFKPDLDQRYTKKPVVISHNKEMIPAVLVNNLKPEEMTSLVADYRCVMIDEVNFFDESLIAIVKGFLAEGREVYVAGLTHFADGEAWGPMNKLIAMSDEKVELTANCDGRAGKCRAPATRSYRKRVSKAKISVAGPEEYGAACEKHYRELHRK